MTPATEQARLERGGSTLHRHVAGFGIATFVSAGILKQTPFASWLPVDLTLLSATILVGLLALRLLNFTPDLRAVGPMIILLSALFPGIVLSVFVGSDLSKTVVLATLVPLAAVGPVILLTDKYAITIWLRYMCGIALLVAIGLIVFPSNQFEETSQRFLLSGAPPITTSWALCVGTLISVHFALCSRGLNKLFWTFSFGVTLLSTILVASRGPLVALGIGFLILMLLHPSSKVSRIRFCAIAAAIGAVLIVIASKLSTFAVERLVSLVTGRADDSGRSALRAIAYESFRESPWGIGWGEYSRLPDAVSSFGAGDFHPHNLLLELLVENGIIGTVVLLLALTWVLWKYGWLERREALTPILLSIVGFALTAAQFSSDIASNRLLWAALGATVAYSFHHGRQQRAISS